MDMSKVIEDTVMIDLKDLFRRVKVNDPTFTSVALQSRQITAEYFKILVYAMRSNNVVRLLDLTNNNLTDESVSNMILAFSDSSDSKNDNSLVIDKIPKEGISSGYYPIAHKPPATVDRAVAPQELSSQELISCLPPSSLHCHIEKNIGEKDSSKDSDGLSSSLSLRSVNHGNCHITKLILSDNEIGDDGAIPLAKFLQFSNRSIKTLAVDNNNIGNSGASAFAQMLYSNCNTTLKHLNIDKNNFATVMVQNDSTVENGVISEESGAAGGGSFGGATQMAKSLTVNTSLKSLQLGYVDDETLRCLSTALMVNYAVKKIVVYGSSEEHRNRIDQLLGINNSLSLEKARKKKLGFFSLTSENGPSGGDTDGNDNETYECNIAGAVAVLAFLLTIVTIIILRII